MQQHVKSENIHIFPFGSGRNVDPLARVFNEQNITKLVKNVGEKSSYVVSYNKPTREIEFIINGYYVSATLDSDQIEGPLYAGIQTVTDTANNYTYLTGGDDDGVFTGVRFSSSEFSGKGITSFQVLDADGNVPPEAYTRFTLHSVDVEVPSAEDITYISGGTSASIADRKK